MPSGGPLPQTESVPPVGHRSWHIGRVPPGCARLCCGGERGCCSVCAMRAARGAGGRSGVPGMMGINPRRVTLPTRTGLAVKVRSSDCTTPIVLQWMASAVRATMGQQVYILRRPSRGATPSSGWCGAAVQNAVLHSEWCARSVLFYLHEGGQIVSYDVQVCHTPTGREFNGHVEAVPFCSLLRPDQRGGGGGLTDAVPEVQPPDAHYIWRIL